MSSHNSNIVDKTVTLSVIRYKANLGPIAGRPDLPPFDFRCFEVFIRKHHKGFWVKFNPSPSTQSIDVSLCYYPNLGNIRRAFGGMTQLIGMETLDTTISVEEDATADAIFSAMNVHLLTPSISITSAPSMPMVPDLTKRIAPAPLMSTSPAPSMPSFSFSSLSADAQPTSSGESPSLASLLSTPPTSSPPLPFAVPTIPLKRKNKSATKDRQSKKGRKTVQYNDELEKLIELEKLVQQTVGEDYIL